MTKVYSLLSNDNAFTIYEPASKDSSVSKRIPKKTILIKGGANVRDKAFNSKKVIATEVSDADMKLLTADPSFKAQVDGGFIFVGTPPKVTKKDRSAPLTEEDVKEKMPKAEVVTNQAKPE